MNDKKYCFYNSIIFFLLAYFWSRTSVRSFLEPDIKIEQRINFQVYVENYTKQIFIHLKTFQFYVHLLNTAEHSKKKHFWSTAYTYTPTEADDCVWSLTYFDVIEMQSNLL